MRKLPSLGVPLLGARSVRRYDSRAPAGALEIAALILLPLGGIILQVIGWFIGVILLCSSRVWTTGEKLAGTLLFPGGLLAPVWLTIGVSFTSTACSPPIRQGQVTVQGCYETGPTVFMQVVQYVLFAALVIVPIAVAILLARRMRAGTAPV